MAVVPVVLYFIPLAEGLRRNRARDWLDPWQRCAYELAAPMFVEMELWGLSASTDCRVCGKRMRAHSQVMFERIVAVEVDSFRAKELGMVCKKCVKLPVETKADAVKVHGNKHLVN
jgi:hypothetical protein